MLPKSPNIEIPILQELNALGGSDDVRFLYERLIPYFPQISESEAIQIKNGKDRNWKKSIQKAGKSLNQQNLIRRERGFWSITDIGKRFIENENSGIIFTKTINDALSHQDIQTMICEVGVILGYFSEKEFEYYDVIWRESQNSPRISHVFEVQSKGNIDSAFAKLKRAYDAQRSKPFLILSSERDSKRALKSLNQEFRELERNITVLSFVELRKIHQNLTTISDFLPSFLEK
ncbi:MAG TPA: winged helix-turn-helix domain-containing protein [Pyrinomonadaceae bacterium]|nr:winged helix-turn-helix domain-containing protein [Pyrinomonadaceae bacterium]